MKMPEVRRHDHVRVEATRPLTKMPKEVQRVKQENLCKRGAAACAD